MRHLWPITSFMLGIFKKILRFLHSLRVGGREEHGACAGSCHAGGIRGCPVRHLRRSARGPLHGTLVLGTQEVPWGTNSKRSECAADADDLMDQKLIRRPGTPRVKRETPKYA